MKGKYIKEIEAILENLKQFEIIGMHRDRLTVKTNDRENLTGVLVALYLENYTKLEVDDNIFTIHNKQEKE